MPSVIPAAKADLGVPTYTQTFDQYDDTKLFVGGGGGPGKNGVANKIVIILSSFPYSFH